MDFRRIQWIFLVAFIAIDIFLFVSFASNNQFTVTSKNSSREATILKEMKDDSITVDDLSSSRGAGYYISSDGSGILGTKTGQLRNQNVRYTDNELTSSFENQIAIDRDAPQKVLNKVVANQNRVLFGSHYVYDEQLTKQDDDAIVYVQKGPGEKVLSTDGEIRFRVNAKNQVTGYTQTYLHAIKTLREKEATISQKKAVIWLYQHNEISNNSKIKWAKLGYTKLLSLKGNTVYIPTWVINIQTKNTGGSQTKRINAFTGTLIKSNTNLTSDGSSSQ
ncbi:two-component system regulatory protein YycI [Paucilactobacillus kaifaensis]|uniref:two-component system regulatory protein YycI n=1 Tax=Paucilactobacillus kaifaensis TaxID=2559921 RepID=UPI0010F9066D|nr:two-component system regulatory protein YycI [Paucilactobacillus kaifaensis]